MMAMTMAPFFNCDSSEACGRRTFSTISAPVDSVLGYGGAGSGKIGVEDAGLQTGTRLDSDFGAETDHLLDGFRRCRDPRLVRIDLGSNRDSS